MFFHKKLGWLTPTVVTSPSDDCPALSLPTCSAPCTGGCVLPSLGPGSPAACTLLCEAGPNPPASPPATGDCPACEGLSAPVLKASESPTMLEPCSPSGANTDPWREENMWEGDLPDLSVFLTVPPVPGGDSPCALRRQPDCLPAPCLSHLPLCQDPCGSLCFIPCTTMTTNLPPCAVQCGNALSRAMGLPLARKCANIIPCTGTCPCATKCANALPCAVEIPPAPNCASTASCATKGATTIPYATKGVTTTCPCGTKCMSVMPCAVAIPAPPQCTCPAPCTTKSAISAPCTTPCPSIIPCTPLSCCKRPPSCVHQPI